MDSYLALTQPFAGELANPLQMTAFTYSESPPVLADDAAFSAGPGVGALMPDAQLNGGFLSDQLGKDFTALCFDAEMALQIEAASSAATLLSVVTLAQPSEVAQ